MSTPTHTPRPQLSQLFMAMPLVFGGLLMLSVLVLGGLVYRGFSPSGERITLHLTGSCAAQAQPVIEARIATVGLGAPEVVVRGAEALDVTVTLPGLAADREATAVPRMLSRQGVFSVRDGETELVSGAAVEGASLQLDESGVAIAVVTLEQEAARALGEHVKADPEGTLTLWLDDELLAERPNTALVQGQELRIVAAAGTPQERMVAATDQVVVLQSGPLPCVLSVAVEGGAQ